MKFLTLLVCAMLSLTTLYAQKLTLDYSNVQLSVVLKEIQNKSEYKFIYNNSLVDVNIIVSIKSSNDDIVQIMNKLTKKTNIGFKIVEKQISLFPIKNDNNKEKANEVKGRITDSATGESVPGAVIQVKGGHSYTISDNLGAFIINAQENSTLVVTCLGMEKQEIPVQNRSSINIQLKAELITLSDVVVTGYQTLSKERAAGSFATITTKEIQNKLQSNVISRIEGLVPGLNIYKGQIQIRGVSTIYGNKAPLYVVDDVPFEGEPGSSYSPLDVLNPSEVANITVLKDATAASIYGARSANGVIVITTKKGELSPTKVSYNGSLTFQGLPDNEYANRMNSNELVDYQLALMKSYPKLNRKGAREFQNGVQVLMLDFKDGKITEQQFNDALIPFRTNHRYDQVVDEFLRKNSVKQQHNLSFSGGSQIYKYNMSINYAGNAPYEKSQYENRIGVNIKNTFDFYKWLQVDVGLLYSQVNSDYDNGITGMSILNGGLASYYMLRDESGNPLQWYSSKSQFEIDRLKSLNLQDETYYPVKELGERHFSYKTNYLNLNIGAKFKIIEGLNLTLRYQTEQTNGFDKQYDTKDAISVKTMINDATQITSGVAKLNIPVGGQVVQNSIDNYSYTMRGQVDYFKNINKKHQIQAIAGAEVRKVITSSQGFYRLGYDDLNLSYTEIDAKSMMQMLTGTESLFGSFSYKNNNPQTTFTDNRYVSFYANGTYTYNQNLNISGSIRMDQSNLFGTDPKYQYRPLWSLGAQYRVLKDYKWIDRVAVRMTYGINGNIPKLNGPYLIARVDRNNTYNEPTMYIDSPPNPQLRWEKTQVFNLGVDFNILKNRINGSIEFYNKNTTDLLGRRTIDPTLGWSSVFKNFGEMYNRGLELYVNSINIEKKDLRWSTSFVFSYNKNKITNIETSSESASSYYSGTNIRKDYPLDALFSVRYKGLNDKGAPVAYLADGTEVLESSKLTKNDLVYSGTATPPYSASISNMFSYKNFDLSFMFVYAGGHVMRDIAAAYCITSHPIYAVGNTDKNMMNYWKNPGDENNPDTNPAFMFQSTVRNGEAIWRAADFHIQRADYIKLRDITLSYGLPERIISKAGIKSAKVSLQCRNLWYWAANKKNLDPEVWNGTSTSPSRGTRYPAEVSIGLNLNF